MVSFEKKLNAGIVLVTPEIADEWLSTNIENNRTIKPNVWKKYAADMKSGHFGLNPDAVAFNDNGQLFNGQHRLTAIVKSGVPALVFAVFGFPMSDDQLLNVDTGNRRTAVDNLEISGCTDEVIINGFSIASRYIEAKLGKHVISHAMVRDFIEGHRAPMKWTIETAGMTKNGGGGKMQAIVAAAVYSAYVNDESREALRAFCRAYRNADYSGCDDYSTEFVTRLRDRVKATHFTNKKGIVFAESCIHGFCVGAKRLIEREDYYKAME